MHTVFAEDPVPLTELDGESLLRVFDSGAGSALRAAQLLYKHGVRPASCVFIGSIHAGLAEPKMAAYTAAKSALRGINLSVAVEWGPQG